jgi:hypothetical protein
MVVCHHAGELIGLVGGEVLRSGLFDVARDEPNAVEYAGEVAPTLDLAALYAGIQSAVRPGRWAG